MKKKTTPNNKKEENVFKKIATDRILRRQIAYESHHMFFVMYFPHYLRYALAEFHKDILRITEDIRTMLACIVAFRGSGKSTLVTFSYALWAILGMQQKKFVLIICQTQAQARQHMANLKHELENNALLKSDMGPFREEAGSGEWAISSLVFRNTGARIMIASIDQSVRGMRHRQYRPDLIILDDIEDVSSVRTLDGRNKIAEWFSREVVPLGDIGTRIIIVANLLHEDGLMMRLKRKIDDKEIRGVYQWFPLIDEDGKCLWPEKFDTPEKLDDLRRSVGDEAAWQQEYLLRIISDASRVIAPEWIHYYDGPIPTSEANPGRTFAAIDLAISEKDTADFTAIVQAVVRHEDDKLRIYILPNPINKRMSFPDAIKFLKALLPTLGPDGKLFIETTNFQEAYLQQLIEEGFHSVEGVKPIVDKRMRLALTGALVRNGTILFPKRGCEEPLAQITNFGAERHDDLVDAFSMLIQQIMEKYSRRPGAFFVGTRGPGAPPLWPRGEGGYRHTNWLTKVF